MFLGFGIFVFDSQIEQVLVLIFCVVFLLNCFYINIEMVGMNLMGVKRKFYFDK